jgi:hypothetical protein
MPKPIVYKSTSVGDLTVFTSMLADRPEGSVSITFDDGFNLEDTAEFRVYMQLEPPEVLDVIDKLIEVHEFYHLILTWHEKVLNACPNAVLFPQALCTWIDKCYLPFCKETQNEENNS